MAMTVRQEHLQVASRLEGVSQVQHWFNDVCHNLDEPSAWVINYIDCLALALTEGFTNAVRHAHAHLPPETAISIDLALAPDQVEIRIWDHGDPFNPELLPEPEPGALLESGYGWFLLRRLADQVTYQRGQDGRNCLSIIKYSL
ncbi:MAG: anti-sigma regulatory factor [Leptolyngbyaceae cyanobacterium SM2_3_12]|nr:anti-sigma regulatory factor [Leptolyngbyaceae cyanobacterium SM2_3_12]